MRTRRVNRRRLRRIVRRKYPHPSRGAKPVKTCGVIRPQRIAKIGAPTIERVVPNWNPRGTDQISASFHYHDQIAAASDAESKFVVVHAKAAIASLCLWIPENGRATAKCCSPTRCSGQVIDGRIVTIEHIYSNAGSIALQIDSRQAVAACERQTPPMLVTLLGIVTLVRLVQ